MVGAVVCVVLVVVIIVVIAPDCLVVLVTPDCFPVLKLVNKLQELSFLVLVKIVEVTGSIDDMGVSPCLVTGVSVPQEDPGLIDVPDVAVLMFICCNCETEGQELLSSVDVTVVTHGSTELCISAIVVKVCDTTILPLS